MFFQFLIFENVFSFKESRRNRVYQILITDFTPEIIWDYINTLLHLIFKALPNSVMSKVLNRLHYFFLNAFCGKFESILNGIHSKLHLLVASDYWFAYISVPLVCWFEWEFRAITKFWDRLRYKRIFSFCCGSKTCTFNPRPSMWSRFRFCEWSQKITSWWCRKDDIRR